MLLIHVEEVRPGMKVGSLIIHPDAPELALLKPGADLDARIVNHLKKLGIHELWVEHDLTADLDWAVPHGLAMVKLEAYKQLKGDMSAIARATISSAQVTSYRSTVTSLVKELVASRECAGLTDSLYGADDGQFRHATNVAYIAMLVGLDLKSYILRERMGRGGAAASDTLELGLGAMLHDIGKIVDERQHDPLPEHHEAWVEPFGFDEREYRNHAIRGYRRLQVMSIRPIARSIVLNHHQRWDGSGWPDMREVTRGYRKGALAGNRIHVYTRIVSAANVLDNLLRDADGANRPPVAALHDFASERFNGWFDPVIRRSVLLRIPPFAVGTQVDLSDGRSAVVISPNPKDPCRPAVRILEREATPVSRPNLKSLDLSSQNDLHVVRYAGREVEQWLYEVPQIRDTRYAA